MRFKKICAYMIAIIVTASLAAYAASELAPPAITRVSGEGQYVNRTFAETADIAAIVLEGEIIKSRTKILDEQSFTTDADGNMIVYETLQVPRTEVTIKIHDILKDEHGLSSNETIIVYDREVSDAVGRVNDERVRFVSQNAYEYHIGDQGIFLIEDDTRLWLDGFTSFYPIKESRNTIESEFDKKYNRPLTDLEQARSIFD